MSIDTGLALFGAVTGTIGAASGYYAFILSGYRIKSQIGIGVRTFGGLVKLNEKWRGGFGLDNAFVPNGEVLYVQVWNKGRMPVNIERLSIYQRKDGHRRWSEKRSSSLLVFHPPIENTVMPHRIDYGSSVTWLYPFHEVLALSKLDLQNRRWDIRVEIELGDETKKRSRNWISSARLDDFAKRWTDHQSKIAQVPSDLDFTNSMNPLLGGVEDNGGNVS